MRTDEEAREYFKRHCEAILEDPRLAAVTMDQWVASKSEDPDVIERLAQVAVEDTLAGKTKEESLVLKVAHGTEEELQEMVDDWDPAIGRMTMHEWARECLRKLSEN